MRANRRERGMALLAALVVTASLAGMGLALVALASTDRRIALNGRRTIEASTAADAAIEGVLAEVAAMPSWSGLIGGATLSAFHSAAHIVSAPYGGTIDLDTITADIQSDTLAAYPLGANTPTWRLFAWGRLSDLAAVPSDRSAAYVAVWAADDPSDADGSSSLDANDTIMLHSEAFGYGRTRASSEAVIARGAHGVRVLAWRTP